MKVMKPELLMKLFESQKDNPNFGIGRGGDEVNGLNGKSVPENCTIIDSFISKIDEDCRTYYLLKIDGFVTMMRVCLTSDGCAYEKFAYIQQSSDKEEDYQSIYQRFDGYKKSMGNG